MEGLRVITPPELHMQATAATVYREDRSYAASDAARAPAGVMAARDEQRRAILLGLESLVREVDLFSAEPLPELPPLHADSFRAFARAKPTAKRRPGAVSSRRRFDLLLRAFAGAPLVELLRGAPGAVIAGGAVLHCLTPPPRELDLALGREEAALSLIDLLPLPPVGRREVREFADGPAPALWASLQQYCAEAPGDVDVFVVADSLEAASDQVRALVREVQLLLGDAATVCASDFAISLEAGGRVVQVVRSVADSVGSLLGLFDLDCCAVAHHPASGRVTAVPRSLWALQTGYNLLPTRALQNRQTQHRALKYVKRGFGCLFVPEGPSPPGAGDVQAGLMLLARNARHASDYGEFVRKRHFGNSLDRMFAEVGATLVRSNTQDRRLSCEEHCYMCGSLVLAGQLLPEEGGRIPVCGPCRATNKRYRDLAPHLGGWVVVVTGARVNIGFAVALKLLRCGATVVGTTRFRADAERRFEAEPDVDAWRQRLSLYELDLRFIPTVSAFAAHVTAKFGAVRGLINNAAQTIRRPAAYYAELGQAPQPMQLCAHLDFPSLAGEAGGGAEVTSWTATAGQVDPVEAVETSIINSVAPMLLMTGLEAAFAAAQPAPCFVVNVTSPEGQFSRAKSGRHPHTNMAKAALNMLTRTTAETSARRGVHVSSVDTGWVSQMTPAHDVGALLPPLSAEDAAARVLQPLLVAPQGSLYSGVLLRNFNVERW